jgi:hypothetical protein
MRGKRYHRTAVASGRPSIASTVRKRRRYGRVRYWHSADMRRQSSDVRSWPTAAVRGTAAMRLLSERTRHSAANASTAALDPSETWAAPDLRSAHRTRLCRRSLNFAHVSVMHAGHLPIVPGDGDRIPTRFGDNAAISGIASPIYTGAFLEVLPRSARPAHPPARPRSESRGSALGCACRIPALPPTPSGCRG